MKELVYMNKALTKFEKLENTLLRLENIYKNEPGEDQVYIDATIQRFEFTIELFWKFLQEYFRTKEVYIQYPKDVFKQAFTSHIIDDENSWLQMLKDRNLTSHTYDEELANQMFKRIQTYVPLMRSLVNRIKKELLPTIEKESD